MKYLINLVLLFACLQSLVKNDIPTHCLQSQVVGKWVFQATETEETNINSLYKLKCGINHHTHVNSIINSLSNIENNKFTKKFSIVLNSDHTAFFSSETEQNVVIILIFYINLNFFHIFLQ